MTEPFARHATRRLAARLTLGSVLLVLVVGLPLLAFADQADAKGNATRIVSGPGIPRPLEIPYPDGWLELEERFPEPIELMTAPPAEVGEPVLVWSEAWVTLPGRALDDLAPDVDPFDGYYYPEAGAVAVSAAGGGEAWYAVDVDRRDVLDRYIRLARLGMLPEKPTVISVHLAEWRELGEPMPFEVRIAHVALSAERAEAFWSELAVAMTRDVLPSEFAPRATNFGWREGPAYVWPLDITGRGRDVLVQFCPADGNCDGWRLHADRGLLLDVQPGLPSWSAFAAHETLKQFILSEAAAVSPGSEPTPPATVARSRNASAPPVPTAFWWGAAGLVAALAAGATAMIRRR